MRQPKKFPALRAGSCAPHFKSVSAHIHGISKSSISFYIFRFHCNLRLKTWEKNTKCRL